MAAVRLLRPRLPSFRRWNLDSHRSSIHLWTAASPSTSPRPLPYASSLATPSSIAKGKHRDISSVFISDVDLYVSLPSSILTSRKVRRQLLKQAVRLAAFRPFHSSSRRNALPLIPAATAAILKSTSVLTAITAISRILISFFPLGTIAALRMVRGVRWLESSYKRPEATPEAEEFWKMWCEGERGKRIRREEAIALLEGEMSTDGAVQGPDGRVAYLIPIPPGTIHSPLVPGDLKQLSKDQRQQAMRWIQRIAFFLPPLPSASMTSFSHLSPMEQQQVEALRRHWISLRMSKDRLALSRWIVALAIGLPILLFTAVYIAALERVPLTGRWRLILLSPEEEDTISKSLAGPNWYRSVINLLTTENAPAPPLLPQTDWRWGWVEATLRRLESGVRGEIHPVFSPPPAKYPIKPRPRVSAMLHSALPGSEHPSGQEHLGVGPPFSLMLLRKDEPNAFSYGFGGNGASGIVVFSGLIDQILGPARAPPSTRFSSIFSTRPPHVTPTEDETLHLSWVLAHEMGHLLLSHQLETLSQQQVLWPSITNLTLDLVRAFIWPLTLMLGPTINDALANVGKTSANEMIDRYGQVGFQFAHELEADRAALRILALSGFDPMAAKAKFATSLADLHEIRPMDGDTSDSWTGRVFKLWSWATHPSAERRTAAIDAELDRWLEERSRSEVEV
ncbi:hypothetical protein M231_03373 [Tremella mesenterica]|uniref:Peptidase M48 domain-containing protein n=1 Tax=Tremella mesenterica TaxID=5217 RepID=A0A4Q1BN76_TREME|nr:hypothetical protein M231_03373 [Tremella mesenterica]